LVATKDARAGSIKKGEREGRQEVSHAHQGNLRSYGWWGGDPTKEASVKKIHRKLRGGAYGANGKETFLRNKMANANAGVTLVGWNIWPQFAHTNYITERQLGEIGTTVRHETKRGVEKGLKVAVIVK